MTDWINYLLYGILITFQIIILVLMILTYKKITLISDKLSSDVQQLETIYKKYEPVVESAIPKALDFFQKLEDFISKNTQMK